MLAGLDETQRTPTLRAIEYGAAACTASLFPLSLSTLARGGREPTPQFSRANSVLGKLSSLSHDLGGKVARMGFEGIESA